MFAGILNCSPGAMKAWEQELREPDGPTRRLLELADRHREVLLAAISTDNHKRGDVSSEIPKLRRAG